MNMETIILTERRKSQKIYTAQFQLHEISKIHKSIEVGRRLAFASGGGKGKLEGTENGYEIALQTDGGVQ